MSLGGILAAMAASNISRSMEVAILAVTLVFVCARAFIWILKARATWRNRNNTQFFQKSKDSDEL